MTTERAGSVGAAPVLVVRAQGSDCTLLAGRSYRVGRDPNSDIVVDEPKVSWQHAILRLEGDQWLLEDAGSKNGTFVGPERVQRVEITDACEIRLGDPDFGPVLSCSTAPAPDGDVTVSASVVMQQPAWQPTEERSPTAIMRLPDMALRIGRANGNDMVVPDLSVSLYHAELRKTAGGGYEIVDLGSHNGTYVAGQRITTATAVTGTDVIGIGLATFRLVGGELQQFTDTGDI